MEAMGLFDALRPLKGAPVALVIRGISDYADPNKELQDEASGGNFRRSSMRSATQFMLDLVDRRLKRGLSDGVERLAFKAEKTKTPRESAITHDLTPMGEGSRYIAYDPLIQIEHAMTQIALTIRASGRQASRRSVQIALRQTRLGWQKIIKPVGDGGVWTCSIDRSENPYSLSLVMVTKDPALSFEIIATDEFGRQTPALAVGPDK
jgi:hypothetical protein